ncbi:MAG TPA: DUF2971 domain-containing protein [Bryobacteraceae bacterium]|jgi:hypothetical protein
MMADTDFPLPAPPEIVEAMGALGLEFHEITIKNEPMKFSLCHYTNFEGLNGILKHHSLWATYSRTLNDGTEQLHGQRVVNAFMKAHLKRDVDEDYLHQVVKPTRLFVTSFCEEPDILSMWKSYAGFGGGYCLEFQSSRLLELCHKSAPKQLVRVAYEKTLNGPIADFMRKVCDSIAWPYSSLYAHMTALKIKHGAFHEEAEWRIIVPDPHPDTIAYRPGHANIKPYTELRMSDQGRLPLIRIIYGPTLRQDAALRDSIDLMLETYGYSGIRVDPCNIPFQMS